MAEPSQDVQRAAGNINRKLRGPARCPICQATDWKPASEIIRILAVIDGVEPDAQVGWEEIDGPWAPIRALVLICQGCGFIRSHLVAEAGAAPTI